MFTNRAEYTADRLVITAGAWAAGIVPSLEELAVPERQVLAWLQPEDPSLFTIDNFPVFNGLFEEGRYYGSRSSEYPASKSVATTTSKRLSTPIACATS